MSENKLANKEQAGALTAATNLEEWGGGQIVTSNDIIIPKILPLNFMSDKVKNGLGKYGEFRDTLSNTLFGNLETPFEIIPFYMEKKWYEFDIISNKAGARKREFARVIPVQDNPAKPGYNDDLKYAEEKLERDRVMDFYVLIPSEVEKGTSMPYVVSFRRTSLKAGKKLASQMFLANARAGKVPAAVTMSLSGKSVQNDDGQYVVQDIVPARESTDAEIKECLKWLKLIRAGQTKLDDSDVASEQVTKEAASFGDF